jgi:xanthine dehydrogenase small subunit
MTARQAIRFYLNQSPVTLTEIAPDLTLLAYLREQRALTGTKEGCAEGDCGACTVLVGRLAADGSLAYAPINACIRFVPTLEATHVVTVEHLAPAEGTLHPVQAAMVAEHGSQCGFCTPGIVMALYGHWLAGGGVDDASFDRALQGNLCRCTGYAAIARAAAAISAHGVADDDALRRGNAAMAARLGALRHGDRIELCGEGRRSVLPASVDDLAETVEAMPGATIAAGCTDLGLRVTKDLEEPATIVFLERVAELQAIAVEDGRLVIGAAASIAEARRVLGRHVPALAELFDRFGGEQVRNAGTVGGNIANGSPVGDLPPALIALGASITLRKGGARRTIMLEDFFQDYRRRDLRPGEFLESIAVPLPGPGCRNAAYKVSKRRDEDISAVTGAFRILADDEGIVREAAIAYGGMAGIPKRARHVEAALLGRPWSRATVETALAAYADDFSPISDWRASADYRMLVARNLLVRFWGETAGSVNLRLASLVDG